MRVDAPLIENGRVVGVRATDRLTGEQTRSAPRWSTTSRARPSTGCLAGDGVPPQPRLNGGTKGSHLIVDPFPGAPTDVVYYESRLDGRLVLIIPWAGRYMIGTTDIRFDEDPDNARCDIGEVDYLLGEVNSLIPQAKLTLDDVLYTFSGVRPLPYVPDKAESSVPRSHVLHDHSATGLPGLVTVVGGKLTTYRQLAEDAVDDAFARLGRKAPPARPASGATSARRWSTCRRWRRHCGTHRAARRAGQAAGGPVRQPGVPVWQLAEQDPKLRRVIDPSRRDGGGADLRGRHRSGPIADRRARPPRAARVRAGSRPGVGRRGRGGAGRAPGLGRRRGGGPDRRVPQWLDKLAVPDPSGPRSESFGAGVRRPAGASG